MADTDFHEIKFKWPSTEPKSVIVTGTFDHWSSSRQLTKTATGFVGTTKIPWNQKILYKFIVDGRWVLSHDQPTEAEMWTGYVNHVYVAPAKPPVVAPATPESVVADAGKPNGRAAAPERRDQKTAPPTSMSATPTAAAVGSPPAEKEPVSPIVPIIIVPVNEPEYNSPIAATPAPDANLEHTGKSAKAVAVAVEGPSTHPPIANDKPIKTDPVEEPSEAGKAESTVSADTAVEASKPSEAATPVPKGEETKNVEKGNGRPSALPSTPTKPEVFPALSPPSSPSSSRFNSLRVSGKKRTSSFLGKIKEIFKSDKDKAKEKK